MFIDKSRYDLEVVGKDNSLPSLLSLAGFYDRPATLGLKDGPNSLRQQCGILDNGRKLDPVITLEGFEGQLGCKPLLSRRIMMLLEEISPG